MKVEVNETPVEQESKYPWIGEATDHPGFIVAFWSDQSATVLKPVGDFNIGDDYPYFNMIKLFTPFTGSITLSND